MSTRTLAACAAATLVIGAAAPGLAQPTPPTTAPYAIAEADVLRLVRAVDPGTLSANARAAAAAAGEIGAGLYPNPELEWEREHLPGGAGESEDVLALSVPLALSGERSARRELARAGSAAARSEALSARSSAAQRALTLFYAAIASQQEAEARGGAVERLEQAATVLARRHEQGTTSGYESARMDLELELARSEQQQAQDQAVLLRAGLATWLGLGGPTPTLQGTLEPTDPAAVRTKLESVRLDARAAQHARQARSHADSAWVPALNLRAGVKLADATSTEVGYVAGLSVEVPLFTGAERLRAETGTAASLAEARASEHAFAREYGAQQARARLDAMMRELTRLDTSTVQLLERLQRAAESGYREGQQSVVELLDAHRAHTRVTLRKLELLHAARAAQVDLRAAIGEFE